MATLPNLTPSPFPFPRPLQRGIREAPVIGYHDLCSLFRLDERNTSARACDNGDLA